MKKSFLILVACVATLGFVAVNTAFKTRDAKLTITNATDSDIDHVHFIWDGHDSGDVLGSDAILSPGEEVTVQFDCSQVGDDNVTIELTFEDGKTYSFEDDVCEGDFTWSIEDDGNHKD